MNSSIRCAVLITVLLGSLANGGCGSTNTVQRRDTAISAEDGEDIRSIERTRLRALVEADIETARRLHADDFQLITPLGDSLTKEQYLVAVGSGAVDYLTWEPDTIDVRMYGNVAAIRYRSQLEIVVQEQKIPLRRYWHTDLYEKRDGQWQVVWSHATEAR